MLDESCAAGWVSRRDARVRRPITGIGTVTADGIPYLRPEIQLFYRAQDTRPRDCPAERAVHDLTDGLSQRGMAMYERLLVAVDHSEVSVWVIAAAKDLATLSRGKVWVLHLREREFGRLGLTPSGPDEEAQEAVRDGVDALIQAGVDTQREVRETVFGQAAREIVEYANEHDAGIIIMGSRGRSDFAGLVLGSTAHKVIHLADRPVLVVR